MEFFVDTKFTKKLRSLEMLIGISEKDPFGKAFSI
jgi:hypothetical protein